MLLIFIFVYLLSLFFFFLEYEKLCLAHFCEIHGPTSIVVTQALAKPATANTTSGGSAPTAITGNNNNNNKNSKNTGIDDLYCDSCRFKLPYQDEDTASLRTRTKHGVTYFSMQTPASAADKLVLKQACLQLLSSELTFNESTPIMVSSSSSSSSTSNGFAYMGLVFKIQDNSSRGHVRKYALIALAETDQTLMRDWTYLANYFNRIRMWMVKSPETTAVPNTSAASNGGGGGGGNSAVTASITLPEDDNDATIDSDYSYTSPPSLFLRIRESKTQSKSLPELLKNDNFFEDLHARFVQIQSTLDKKYNSF